MGQGGAERDSSSQPEHSNPNQKRQRQRQQAERERARKRHHSESKRSNGARSARDPTGLHQIHWAALNNRCDIIERLCGEDPALVSKRCRNNVFADGTPLHLAAMNGSLEAAGAILTQSLARFRLANGAPSSPGAGANGEPHVGVLSELLEARDSEGQTPLMRTAAPRSKRWNNIRELLRKNFWSLSGRAAEVALLLIAAGADWTQTEPLNGMNVMHLAIMNDFDDIVSLLLVLDRRMIGVATLKATLPADGNEDKVRLPGGSETKQTGGLVESGRQLEGTSSSESSPTGSTTRKPLIDSRRDNAEHLLARGLKPLELAVLYGRVKMIGLLWRPRGHRQTGRNLDSDDDDDDEARDQAELKRLLVRACFSDNEETAKFLKPLILKALLAVDLAVVALVWAPAYCLVPVVEDDDQGHERLVSARPSLRGGLFFASYCLALALTLRVMLKNPGFLRRHSVHYLSELASLLRLAPRAREMISRRLGKPQDDSGQRQRAPLIPLDQKAGILIEDSSTNTKGVTVRATDQNQNQEKKQKQKQTQDEDEDRNNKITTLALDHDELSGSADRREAPLAGQLLDIQQGIGYLCHRCQCIRRPRSHHCNLCDHCVLDYDHHCIYLGCCIGRYSRLDFLLALVVVCITSCYGTILQAVSVHQAHGLGGQTGWSHLWHFVGFVWIFKYAVIGGVKAFCQLRRACLGVTMYEEARSKRLRAKFGRRGPPAEISRTHANLSTGPDEVAFWRYLPYEGDQLEQRWRQRFRNLREFTNRIEPDEYLLTLIATDTPLARSLLTRSSDLRIKQQRKQARLK